MCLFYFSDKAVVDLDLLRPLAIVIHDCLMNNDLFDQLIQHFSSQCRRIYIAFDQIQLLYRVLGSLSIRSHRILQLSNQLG